MKLQSVRFIAMFIAVILASACSSELPVAEKVTNVIVSDSGILSINGSELPNELSAGDIEKVLGKPTRVTNRSHSTTHIWDSVGMSIITFGQSGGYRLIFKTSRIRYSSEDVDIFPRVTLQGVIKLPDNISIVSPSLLNNSGIEDALKRSYLGLGAMLRKDSGSDSFFKDEVYYKQLPEIHVYIALKGFGGTVHVPTVSINSNFR